MKQYAIIKYNSDWWKKESTLRHNNYDSSKKYVFILKKSYSNGTEKIDFIEYSNDLEELQNKAKEYGSWYNYPLGVGMFFSGELRAIG